ncbi:MAG TPA: zinc ribbon domain-containing protein [Nocardioides sp.]|uniref:zinc ribbon domain-containing protein n=1 Tax=Nocardioides sp. TaxID=35761 RepID=UPI002E37BB0F|nr:zinc ribbon domain-containing protein [Nocardioides sp.]HEX5086477.1 zinc ribbon domain-containing protein [Nocardioides sp.]
MGSCSSCGHQLGVGRFCTNCGAPVDPSTPGGTTVGTTGGIAGGTAGGTAAGSPVTDDDWRIDTAERRTPAADPRTPPAAVAPPPPPRYPLYADEVVGYTPYGPLNTATTSTPATPASAPVVLTEDSEESQESQAHDAYDSGPDYGYEYDYDEERRSPVLWILAAALVLVLVAAGWWFLVRDGADESADDHGGSGTSQGPTEGSDGDDVASHASAKAPRTAPPNEDVNGDQVSYDASNMLDGVPETAWRAAGNAADMTLVFTLADPTELHRVGMINGYAKTSTDSQGRTFDWYAGNRRIKAVVWQFDDGTKVRQQLQESRELQMTDVPDVVTSKVLLRIVKVSKPGTGNAARDFTAISEVSLVGDPA